MTKSNFLQFESKLLTSIAQLYLRSEESVTEDVNNLQKWMKAQPHLPEILDDKSIQNFLILNKFSIERTKESIDMYYTLRSRIPDMYESINPKCLNMKETMDLMYYIPGPKMTKENYRLVFFKLRKNTDDKLEPINAARHAWNFQEIRLHEDMMFGDILIYDIEGITMTYLLKSTPSYLSKLLAIYRKIYSIPVKGIYILNSNSSYLNTILSVLKTILTPKLFQRIHVCKDTSILFERFPKNILPRDYGGDVKSLEELNEILKLKFAEYEERFDRLDTLRVNESLRPPTLENDDVLGFHGNFKQLNLD